MMTDNKSLALNNNYYDSLMETIAIESNQYLLNKIIRGRAEVAQGHVQQHELFE